ncbi:MAG: hypothetical protein IKK81_06620 [Prevotella sp.]|nr:hypothetical protein [Prevotella sp.]
MPALRLELYKKVFLQDYQVTHPEQYKMYEEVLSFEGGYAFASEDELTVRKTDGSTFRTELRHYESDPFTETYTGRLSNGELFRFVFACKDNPLAQIDPMVTFGSMSTSGWAVHYRVKP